MTAIDWKSYAGSGGWWKRAAMPKETLMTPEQAGHWAFLQGDAERRRLRREHRTDGKGRKVNMRKPKGKPKGKGKP